MSGPDLPWWALPAGVAAVGLVGGWVLTHAVKVAARAALAGRKPPNVVSIVAGVTLTASVAAGMALLAGLPVRWALWYAVAVGLPSPILLPVVVLALRVGAEKLAPGYGDKVHTVLMGADRDRRQRGHVSYTGPDRRRHEHESEHEQTVWNRTQQWWRG